MFAWRCLHTLRWGGFRKPKVHDRPASAELRDAGVTAPRSTDGFGHFLLLFLGLPAFVIALVAALVWVFRADPKPVTEFCSNGQYQAVFLRDDFSRGETEVVFEVDFDGVDGNNTTRVVQLSEGGPDQFVVRVNAADSEPVTQCELVGVD